MPTSTQPVAPVPVENPAALWHRVVEARAELSHQRRSPLNGAHAEARTELLKALEAYAANLTGRGRPIPYVLRDELSLMRRTRHC